MHAAYHDYDFDTIMCFENAQAPVLFTADYSETNASELDIPRDDWVVVQYHSKLYAGVVTKIDPFGAYVKVNVMHKSGGFYKWPKDKDQIYYERDCVLQKIQPPSVVGNCGQFQFSTDFYRYY